MQHIQGQSFGLGLTAVGECRLHAFNRSDNRVHTTISGFICKYMLDSRFRVLICVRWTAACSSRYVQIVMTTLWDRV